MRDPRQIGVGQHPQLAVIVAGGVLIDTFVVRSLQVPGAWTTAAASRPNARFRIASRSRRTQTEPMSDAALALVTGATGYIGGRLVPELLDAGYRVEQLGDQAPTDVPGGSRNEGEGRVAHRLSLGAPGSTRNPAPGVRPARRSRRVWLRFSRGVSLWYPPRLTIALVPVSDQDGGVSNPGGVRDVACRPNYRVGSHRP